jgi:hypothetical protein
MTDGHGVFSVGSLQHSLPTPTTDRKLPVPAQNHRPYYADDILRPRTSSGVTSQHYNVASAGYTRLSPNNWSTEHLPHGLPTRSSTSALSNELMAPPASTASTPIVSTASEINNSNYDASSRSSSEDSTADLESVEQTVTIAPEPAPTRSSTTTGPTRSMYNNPIASSSEITLHRAGLYTYSSDPKRSSMGGPSGTGGELVNGDAYEPLKHSHPLSTFVPIHYAPVQPAPTSATRFTLPTSPHPNLEASSDGASAHHLRRRTSIASSSNS